MSPRDPQGAETTTSWRNVFREPNSVAENGEWRGSLNASRKDADHEAKVMRPEYPRIAIEEVTTTTTISRIPCAGEEQ